MARIPLEDNYDDVINKAQRGLGISDEALAHRAEVPLASLLALKSGEFNETIARRVARHLRLHAGFLVELAAKAWYPEQPIFPNGFIAFNTRMGDMTVNNYLIWDQRTDHAAIFDTGADPEPVLDFVRSEKLRVQYLFLTHTHDDHIAGLEKIVAETKAEVWASKLEPAPHPGAKTFSEGTFFHLGGLSIKTLFTVGHSPGGTTYFVKGLSYPLAIVGDAMFSASMGGAPKESYQAAKDGGAKKVLVLPLDTVIACGHGPITTVKQERKHNAFFARGG